MKHLLILIATAAMAQEPTTGTTTQVIRGSGVGHGSTPLFKLMVCCSRPQP